MKDEYDLEKMNSRKNPYASRLTGSERVRLVTETGTTILNNARKQARRSGMKSYGELKDEMKHLEIQLNIARKRERTEALKLVRKLCREFGFTAGMLNTSLAHGREGRSRHN